MSHESKNNRTKEVRIGKCLDKMQGLGVNNPTTHVFSVNEGLVVG